MKKRKIVAVRGAGWGESPLHVLTVRLAHHSQPVSKKCSRGLCHLGPLTATHREGFYCP